MKTLTSRSKGRAALFRFYRMIENSGAPASVKALGGAPLTVTLCNQPQSGVSE